MRHLRLNPENPQATVDAIVERSSSGFWIHLNGATHFVENQRSVRGAKAAGPSTGDITAPMPGKIIKVLVEEGSQVSAGDTVIVMEAMKMEYTLKTEIDGKMSSLKVTEGQQVKVGALLAKVETSE